MSSTDHILENSAAEVGDVHSGPGELLRETERLVRDAVSERPDVSWPDRPDHVLAQVLRPGDELRIKDLEQYLDEPARPRGEYQVFDAPSFVTLVQRLREPQTTLWAHQPATGATSPSITAVFNDADGPDGVGIGWRDHRAKLVVKVDPDWAAWAAIDGKALGQVAFAEFVNDHLHNIVDPPAAGLVGAITTFNVKRNVTFSQAVNLESGAQEFTWLERDEAAGKVKLPTELTVRTRPYFGSDPVDLQVALRHRVTKEGGLSLIAVRIRPDIAEEQAWSVVTGRVSEELPDLPMLQGSAPASLRAGS
ncbi:hypothetical protein GCM10009613_60780 [Pseudonocardia kongjuensis]|uniref:DUF2303 family protein n=1 Tax=Pseudonocardia kongjuensis TaxID=102227 RepID=A0ABN1Y9R6_9PSEU